MTLLEERLQTPTHKGLVDSATCSADAGNPACGDILTLQLRLRNGRVEEAGFQCLGSPYQQAVASILCDLVSGRTLDEARGLPADELLARMPDLPARHRHLARLALDALRGALA